MGLLRTNNYHINNSRTEVTREVTKNVNVVEKRAPTDESVRLLNEMEEKAKQNIIETIKIDSNILKAIIVYYHDDMIFDRLCYHAKFGLNGIEYLIEGHLDKYDLRREAYKNSIYDANKIIVNLLFKSLSEQISEELIKGSDEHLNKILFR